MSKRDHILDVAEALFNELGYTAVGVDLIRDTAKISKTSMYRYFGSKNNLVEAVLIRRHHRFEDALNIAVTTEKTAEKQLDAILDWHFTWFRTQDFKGCMFMHAVAEFKGHDEKLTACALRHKKWLKSLLLSVFESEPTEKDTKSDMILTFLEGMIIRAEFGDVVGHEPIYRAGAKNLAFLSVPTAYQ